MSTEEYRSSAFYKAANGYQTYVNPIGNFWREKLWHKAGIKPVYLEEIVGDKKKASNAYRWSYVMETGGLVLGAVYASRVIEGITEGSTSKTVIAGVLLATRPLSIGYQHFIRDRINSLRLERSEQAEEVFLTAEVESHLDERLIDDDCDLTFEFD